MKQRPTKPVAAPILVKGPVVPLPPPLDAREKALMAQVTAQTQRAENIQKAFDIFKDQRKPWVPGRQFGVVLMVAWSDYAAAVRLLDWMQALGGLDEGRLMISVPHDLPGDLVVALKERTKSWLECHIVPRPFPLSKEHWPQGPNWSFACASQWCHAQQWDFLLLEPDAVPLKPGWLDGIEREYRGCGRAFMGHYEPPGPDHQMHLAGVAVYHWETYQRTHWHEFHRAWDVAMGPTLVAEAHESRTIQQDWGKWNEPPVFHRTTDLARVRPDALLFHRNKDGSLIQRLRETCL
jgi:hypothetical protein